MLAGENLPAWNKNANSHSAPKNSYLKCCHDGGQTQHSHDRTYICDKVQTLASADRHRNVALKILGCRDFENRACTQGLQPYQFVRTKRLVLHQMSAPSSREVCLGCWLKMPVQNSRLGLDLFTKLSLTWPSVTHVTPCIQTKFPFFQIVHMHQYLRTPELLSKKQLH